MPDPVVGITNGVPTSGTGTITTLGQTLLDGAQVTQGAIADAAVTAGATGTVSAKLRALSRDIGSLVTAIGSTAWDLGAGTGGTRTQRVIIDTASQTQNVATNADGVATSSSLVATPVASYLYGYNGTTFDRLQVDAAKNLKLTNQPSATGGLSVFRSLDLDETEEDVKTTAGCLYKLRITNRTTSVRYVKLYNDTAANVIVGTTAPLDTIPVPANASDYTVLTESFGGLGLTFSVALSMAATTGFADADVGAPGANDVIVSAYYK